MSWGSKKDKTGKVVHYPKNNGKTSFKYDTKTFNTSSVNGAQQSLLDLEKIFKQDPSRENKIKIKMALVSIANKLKVKSFDRKLPIWERTEAKKIEKVYRDAINKINIPVEEVPKVEKQEHTEFVTGDMTFYNVPKAKREQIIEDYNAIAKYLGVTPKLVIDGFGVRGFYRKSEHSVYLGLARGYERVALVHEMIHATGQNHTAGYTSHISSDVVSPAIEEKIFGNKSSKAGHLSSYHNFDQRLKNEEFQKLCNSYRKTAGRNSITVAWHKDRNFLIEEAKKIKERTGLSVIILPDMNQHYLVVPNPKRLSEKRIIELAEHNKGEVI